MIHLKIQDSDYCEKDGKHPVGQYIADSLQDSWGSGGAIEEMGSEITNLREAFGRLIQELTQNDLLYPEQVHYIAKGYSADAKLTFEEG